ncbi:hypothetical protein, partial [Chryseobacterium sp. CH25]|uniref:hypothetical protein n=1 Tax=Chryseobacterium sp. CH25 TaxID=713559 RepID=UPI00162AA18C
EKPVTWRKRNENYQARAGEEASYIGSGAESFPGLQPQNEVNKNRQNIGAYMNAEWDVTKNLLLGGSAMKIIRQGQEKKHLI